MFLCFISLEITSKIPLINLLLFGVAYSLAISKYSLMVTLEGIDGKYKNSEILQKSIDTKIKWLKINYGEGLIFSHSLLHGNKINLTKETRWSFNCRFKSLMSPYDMKDLAETFLPINIRPATNLGINYVHPKTEK